MAKFELASNFKPQGDQPRAIDQLLSGLQRNRERQTLLGVTGSGKTFTMANVIAQTGLPTLILAHNKTLAAQLYQEFKALFPHNAVEYFVSYYDYYQPEAYIARTDTYIEKDLAINEQIERLRLSATRSLVERSDVIIVSSVSCIYGLGMPEHYIAMQTCISVGQNWPRQKLLLRFIEMQYDRSEDLSSGLFRVRGDIIEILPAYEEDLAFRIELFGDEVEKISSIDPLTGHIHERLEKITIYPGSHYVIPQSARENGMVTIRQELDERAKFFEQEGRWLERERIIQRTRYDLEMIEQTGHCKGIENYSRHFSRRTPGAASSCLISYFPKKFLIFVDESHQTLPQIRAMYNGDRARKTSLIEFGFRLPSAYDNRPLKFEEFDQLIDRVIYVSATPSPWEIAQSAGEVVEQIIRPTGLVDPLIEIKPTLHQVDDVVEQIRQEIAQKGKVLVTTLTKKMAEELSRYLDEVGVRAKYLHSEIDTLERIAILRDLREDLFDVLVGINLLREGLDIPEISLVAILDADKEGFLRSATALIQTCGRAARNIKGRVIMYADKQTESMRKCIDETQRRRERQTQYNLKNGIIPYSTKRSSATGTGFEEYLPKSKNKDDAKPAVEPPKSSQAPISLVDIDRKIADFRQGMQRASKEFRFEEAIRLRDLMRYYEHIRLELM
jgi:excinuclease ABC subunit B